MSNTPTAKTPAKMPDVIKADTVTNLDAVMLDFRVNYTPEIDDQTPTEYIALLVQIFRNRGIHFLMHENATSLVGSQGLCMCQYVTTLLMKTDEGWDTHAFETFTVIGNPVTARATAYNMAMVEFAGAYPELEIAYRNSANGNIPVPAPAPQGVAVGEGPGKAQTPTPEMQEALHLPEPSAVVVTEEAESDLIESRTPDGVPILINLFTVNGDAETNAEDAAGVLTEAVTDADSLPMLQAIWQHNESNLDYVKDFSPDSFNGLLSLFQQRADDLTETVVETVASETPALTPRRTNRAQTRNKRRKKVA